CNWLIPSDIDAQFCRACVYNRTVPDATQPANLRAWRDLEIAKHRLIFTLIKLDLPMPTRNEDPNEGLAFDFLVEDGSTK
ncbi:putative zinc-binding metallopeptidase, partial [Acetatifactor sp. DFI.5.50]|nr:putative zinc-binding metallopeptidase [Acetatifactor sp. DFI.5.50]